MTNVIQLKDKLQFQNTPLEIYSVDGAPWMRSRDLAIALGYKDETSVRKLFDRNKDEFTASMSQTVKLTVSGNLKKSVRLFSPRGCHLIAIMAKTKMAKAFRKWVLDVLETYGRDVKPQQEITPPTFYAKTILADGTDSEVATRNQVKHLIGRATRMLGILERIETLISSAEERSMNHSVYLDVIESRVKSVDEKIRVFAVDSDSLSAADWVLGHSIDTMMKHKSYKDSTIQRLKEENAKLRKAMEVMVRNKAMESAA
jgi:prophage antirepressor-like protein